MDTITCTCCPGEPAPPRYTYPESLCIAILKGWKRQLQSDGVISRRLVGSIAPEEENCDEWIEEYMHETWGEYYDIASHALESSKVQAARREEIEGLRQRGTNVKVPIAECWSRTGKASIRTRFVDVNKGDNNEPNYRSRLVATEIRASNPNVEMFAAMPPLEARKALFSLAATKSAARKGEVLKKGFIDVSKAYLLAKVKRGIYVQIPKRRH